jgi:uncharacterized protein (TIGR02231 family)
MKNKKFTTLTLVSLVFATVAFAQKQMVVTPKISDVTVFLEGAEITFSESVALKKGNNTVVFKGISPSLVMNSVQVTVGNSVEVISVTTRPEYFSPVVINPKLKSLTDSIATLEEQLVLLSNQLDAYDMEKQTLIKNQNLGGTTTGVSLIELTKAADFFRERTLKINTALTSLTKQHKLLTKALADKRLLLQTEIAKLSLMRYAVVVNVNAKSEEAVVFKVRHLVLDASWEANYDIVATELNNPITLRYKALVYNATGVDWEKVNVTLSTADISMDATRPTLTTWTLNYKSDYNEGYLNNLYNNRNFSGADSVAIGNEVTSVAELNTAFKLEQTHSVPSGGEPYRIAIQSESLNATFEYLAIPKMEMSAFLLAKVTGWEKLNLIDGSANVYFGNTYIGQSAINTRLIGDTLELSFGRDNQIVVSRTKVEDKASTSAIGGKRSESFTYEIQLRNNRKVPVAIRLQDQLPVSQEKEITVDVEETSGAALDAPSGRLQWLRTLAPGESQKYRIAFVVRYPKNKTVNIRKSRSVRAPRYRH